MSFLTAKDILISNDFLNPDALNEDKKKSRHPKHEFQAYAYRLAHDLNDLEHLQIYLRLAKSVERSIMEQAYRFVIDSTSDDKGILFLWKLKQIRAEIKKKKHLFNFDHEFVSLNLKRVRNKIAVPTIQKASNQFEKKVEFYNQLLSRLQSDKKLNVLLIGLESYEILEFFMPLNSKITGVDISNEVVKIIKSKIEGVKKTPKPSLVCKDLLKLTLKDNSQDVVVIDNFWKFISIDSELKYLQKVINIMKLESLMVMGFENNEKQSESWNEFILKGKEELVFTKKVNKEHLKERLLRSGFEVLEIVEANDLVYIVSRKLLV